MLQLIQIAGALAILAAFVAAQAGVLGHASRSYLMLNFVGATVLVALAYLERQWGFLLLEGAWALVAGYGLIARRRGKERSRAGTNETCAPRSPKEPPTTSSAGGASS